MTFRKKTSVALLLAFPTLALASQDFPERYSSLGIEAGYVDSGKSNNSSRAQDDLSNYYEFGVNFTHQFTPEFSLLFQGSYAEPETRNFNLDTELWRWSAGARVHPDDYRLGGWRPFGGLGYSYTDIDVDSGGGENEDALYVEGGLQKMLSPRFMLEAGVRGRAELADGYFDDEYFAGIHYLFNRQYPSAPQPEPLNLAEAPTPPADSDGDGVPDFRDKCPDTPEGALVDSDGCPKKLTKDIHKTLYVEFEFDKTEVRREFYPAIGELATLLKQYPDSFILLEGHTDSIGPSSYNQTLSKSRADAVMKVLVNEFGIDADRITTSGMGESQPIASNDTAEGRARNRRVEAIVSGQYQEIQKK